VAETGAGALSGTGAAGRLQHRAGRRRCIRPEGWEGNVLVSAPEPSSFRTCCNSPADSSACSSRPTNPIPGGLRMMRSAAIWNAHRPYSGQPAARALCKGCVIDKTPRKAERPSITPGVVELVRQAEPHNNHAIVPLNKPWLRASLSYKLCSPTTSTPSVNPCSRCTAADPQDRLDAGSPAEP